jgi:hypothetical protein
MAVETTKYAKYTKGVFSVQFSVFRGQKVSGQWSERRGQRAVDATEKQKVES